MPRWAFWEGMMRSETHWLPRAAAYWLARTRRLDDGMDLMFIKTHRGNPSHFPRDTTHYAGLLRWNSDQFFGAAPGHWLYSSMNSYSSDNGNNWTTEMIFTYHARGVERRLYLPVEFSKWGLVPSEFDSLQPSRLPTGGPLILGV